MVVVVDELSLGSEVQVEGEGLLLLDHHGILQPSEHFCYFSKSLRTLSQSLKGQVDQPLQLVNVSLKTDVAF